MQILDSTLREGEQRYGVFFTIKQKIELATELASVVDFIEIGSPLIAQSYAEAAEKILARISPDQVVVHCRLNADCVRSAYDFGARWVGLFVAIREDMHGLRYRKPARQTAALVKELLELCGKLGLHVRLTCEDASRTPIDQLIDFYSSALDVGADRVGFADTTGTLTPDETYNYLMSLKRGGIPLSRLHTHFHNDRGLANENAEVAVGLGVACIDGTITGIGERIGIAKTEHLASLLSRATDSHLDKATTIVTKNTRFHPASQLRFAHKAGVHIDGVLKYPATYENFPPESFHARRVIVLSKLSGRSGVRYYLHRMKSDSSLAPNQTDDVLALIKRQDCLEIATDEEFVAFMRSLGSSEIA